MHLRTLASTMLAVTALASIAPAARAQIYSDADIGVGFTDLATPANRPRSEAARGSYLADLVAAGASFTTNGLEAFTGIGQFTDLGGGITATYTGVAVTAGIRIAANSTLGRNTTEGGIRYLRFAPSGVGASADGSITLSFADPINTFGAFFTGVQRWSGLSAVEWGSGSSFTLLETGGTEPFSNEDEGGIQWFSFISPTPISSITLRALSGGVGGDQQWSDSFGIDDLVYGTVSIVPEPSTYALMATGLVGLAVGLRRRRR